MHMMYVDESGDPGFPKIGKDFPTVGGPTTYFVRVGVILHAWKWSGINNRIMDFKRARGIAWNAEIKAAHIRAGQAAFARWSPENRTAFLRDLLETIGKEIDIHLLAVVIDKSKVDTSQRQRFVNPVVRSLELLLERYNEFLGSQRDKCGIAILDSTEASSDENLRYFQSYLREFSDHLDSRRIVEGTLFMPSHTTNLLQIADICTNVIYRHHRTGAANADEYDLIQPRLFASKMWPE